MQATMLIRVTTRTFWLLSVCFLCSKCVDGLPANSTCNCDCSIFVSTTLCTVQRLTARLDCPCCLTCLRQAGELCDPVAFPCDGEFDLSCNAETSICEGPFKLRADNVTHDSLSLAWQKSPFYSTELYVFYTTTYTKNIREWARQKASDDGTNVIRGLPAATSFYITLVPQWQGLFQFQNRSEVIVARTEGCFHRNRSLAVNEAFSDGCAYNCTCTKEGLLACVERKCPLIYKKGDIQDHFCQEHDDPTSDDPCCVVYTCQDGLGSPVIQPGRDDFCSYKGHKYSLSTDFYADNCTKACHCNELGVVECRTLKCPVTSTLTSSCVEWSVRRQSDIQSAGCCPNVTCINDGSCEINGTRYANGDIVPASCDKSCLCNHGKVICETTCRDPSHTPPHDDSCLRFAIGFDAAHCCQEWKCVAKAPTITSKSCFSVNGMPFGEGDNWTDNDHCRLRNCTCTKNSAGLLEAVCVGGCPVFRPEELIPTPGCLNPVVHSSPVDACACPAIRCFPYPFENPRVLWPKDLFSSRDNIGDPLAGSWISISRMAALNSTSAEIILNISASMPVGFETVLETHIAHLNELTAGPNGHDQWQVSATKLERIEPIITEFISGFQPNATYRLRSRLILTDTPTGENLASPFSPIVLLTMPPNGMNCVLNGSLYANEAIVPVGCGQQCICRNAKIMCSVVQCEVEESVLMPSEFCPIPVLVKAPGDCCPRWECHPSSTGCRLGDAIYSHGDQWRNGCAEECTCRHGRVACKNLCDDLEQLVPHPSCRAVLIVGSCCPVWQCREGVGPQLDFIRDSETRGMNLTVDNLTATKVHLMWVKPNEIKNIFGFNLLVEEAVTDRESFKETNLIHPDVREYTLRDLSPGVRYKATLRAVDDGNHVLGSQSIHFQTLELTDVKMSVWLGYIGTDRAEATWDCIQCDDLKNLKLNLVSSSHPTVAIGDVTLDLPKITLTELNAKENYRLWLEGNMSGGTVVKSNVLAFTTRSVADFNEIPKEFQNQTNHHLLSTPMEQKLSTALIVVSTLAASFLFAFFLVVCICMRRRSAVIKKSNPYQTYTDNMFK